MDKWSKLDLKVYPLQRMGRQTKNALSQRAHETIIVKNCHNIQIWGIPGLSDVDESKRTHGRFFAIKKFG